jgi:beta-glucanase (GH16 family)
MLVVLLVAPRPRTPTSMPSTEPASKWKLVFSDEFDQPGAPDPVKWSRELGMLRNAEAQYYTDRPENARVQEGHLLIEARKESHKGADGKTANYTSASLETRGHFEFTYGRIEVRAKLPKGRGAWPAIWTLGSNISTVGWPACGEIDVMEHVGYDPDVIHATIHTTSFNHIKHTEKSGKIPLKDPHSDFHVYAAEWTGQKIEMFLDGQKYFTFENPHTDAKAWPFDQPQYLKLNLAVGGAWGGRKGIDDTSFPQQFLIDYVRIYQESQK